jgi:NAD+ diphosphatase
LVDGSMTADGAGAGGAMTGGSGTGGAVAGGLGGNDAVREQEAQEIAGDLGGFVLARSEVDRASVRREDPDWITAAWADDRTRVLVLDEGQALIRFGDGAAELVLVPPAQAPEGVRFLLGADADETAYFGVVGPPGGLGAGALPPPGTDMAAPAPGVRPASLRQAATLLGDRDAGLFTHAVALANWHARHTHCPRCGALTVPAPAGHMRRCPVDGSEHFPRIDPAVIMLVTDNEDRCLLARNRMWPPGRVSILAGFVEAGESAEQTVAREVWEETGIAVSGIRYVGSQAWPMPQSLMLGFRAEAGPGQQITVDDEEIAEARFLSRAELAAEVASGELLLPPPVSIAHQIIQSWYGGPLPGTW